MRYVFDTGIFIDIFRRYRRDRDYYRDSFPKLWEKFDSAVEDKIIISTREVLQELSEWNDAASDWANNNEVVFTEPAGPETDFMKKVFREYPHSYQLVKQQAILKGKPWADPFVMAKARVEKRCVITTEKYKENGISIPYICKGNSIGCTDLQGFMELEEWKF